MFKDKHMKLGFSFFFFPEMLIKNLVTNHQNLGIKRQWLECLNIHVVTVLRVDNKIYINTG